MKAFGRDDFQCVSLNFFNIQYVILTFATMTMVIWRLIALLFPPAPIFSFCNCCCCPKSQWIVMYGFTNARDLAVRWKNFVQKIAISPYNCYIMYDGSISNFSRNSPHKVLCFRKVIFDFLWQTFCIIIRRQLVFRNSDTQWTISVTHVLAP